MIVKKKEKLYTWISRNKEQIREFFNKTTNGGCSRIREWNEFIKHYSLLYVEMENICLENENKNWNPQAKWLNGEEDSIHSEGEGGY